MTASSSSRNASSTSNTPLDKLLLRCARHFHSNGANTAANRPPDAATLSLGRALALQLNASTEGQLLKTLHSGNLPASVAHAMLMSVAHRLWQQHQFSTTNQQPGGPSTSSLSDYSWLAKWILQLEDTLVKRTTNTGESLSLDACVRAFGVYSYLLRLQQSQAQNQQQSDDALDVTTFHQLHWISTKMAVWKTILHLAIEDATLIMNPATPKASTQPPATRIIGVASPYLAVILYKSCLRDDSSTAANQTQQHQMAVHILLRYLWMAWTSSPTCLAVIPDCVLLLQWMTKALQLYLDCHAHLRETRDMALDLAENWLSELAFLAQAAIARFQQEGEDEREELQFAQQELIHQQRLASSSQNLIRLYQLLKPWMCIILHDILPQLLRVPNNNALVANTSLLIPAIQGALQAMLENVNKSHFLMDNATTLRLATSMLTLLSLETKISLLELLLHCAPTNETGRFVLLNMATIVASQDDGSGSQPVELINALRKQTSGTLSPSNEPETSQYHTTSLIDCLKIDAYAAIIDQLTYTADFENVRLSPTHQVAVMMFGLAIMTDGRHERLEKGIKFLSSVLDHYPHIGISLLPIIIDRINTTAQKGSAKTLDLYLSFLCGPIVRDPLCGQEVFNMVGMKMTEDSVPVTIKIFIIRKLSKLCESNKRLYRRIIDLLGALIANKQVEIRLAVAATLSDLARDDLIRDVSDVIGWVQALLTEKEDTGMHSLLIHYAILTLHYLVIAQELDFDVVIKVLNKRLCNIADLGAVTKLTPVVQESLALLLGDGESDASESSQEDEIGDSATKTVSPQVSGAIETLLHLGIWLSQKNKLHATQERVRINVYKALGKYSAKALEMDIDNIKSAVASEAALEGVSKAPPPRSLARYMAIRDVALAGIKRPLSTVIKSTENPIVQFARRILCLEEDAIGYVIWKKRDRRQTVDVIATMTDSLKPGVLSGLPLPAEVRELAIDRSSPGASIALLLVSDGSQLSALRDNGDAAFESADPLWMVFALQGYLHLAVSVLSKIEGKGGIGEVLTEVGSWYEVFVTPDTMYLAFASLSIYIPHHLREGESTKPYVEELCLVVLDAYMNQRFQKDDVAKICISVVAVSTLRYGSLERVNDIINILEQTVRGYGGQRTFGAFYGLALIGQALQRFCNSDVFFPVVDEVKDLIYRICGFLVEELLDCYEECDESLHRFVDCLKNGDATSDLVVSMSDLDSNSISLLMTKSVVARYLFISCAVCLPGLAVINGALLLAALRMMEAFEWGGGKGIAFPPMLRACEDAALFSPEELSHIYKSFGSSFESKITDERTELDSEGLEDIFFALNGTTVKSTSHGLRRNLVGNRDLFDEDGCVTSIISIFNQIAPLPCLGASYFTAPIEVQRRLLGAADHESIVEIIRAAANETESKYSDMAIILLALLSSLRDERESKVIAASLPQEVLQPSLAQPDKGCLLNFDSIPRPQSGTFLAGVIDEIELQSNSKSFAALVRHTDARTVSFAFEDESLTISIAVLEAITLPGQFVSCFLEPLMQLKKVTVTERCISLLCSQLKGRRRAAYDAKDYVGMALKLANLSSEEWHGYVRAGNALTMFVSTLPGIAQKMPSDGYSTFENIWRNCFADRHQNMELVGTFLASTKEILSSTSLPPKLTNALRRLIMGIITEDVLDLPLTMLRAKCDNSKPSLIERYTLCLGAIPRASLEECEFFNVSRSFDGFGPESKKVISMLTMMEQNYFTRMSEELTIIGAWLVQKCNSPIAESDRESLHLIVASFANLSIHESTPVKCARLLKALEALLTFKSCGTRLGVQWLAIMIAYWCRSEPVGDELTLGFLYITASGLLSLMDSSKLVHMLEQAMTELPGNLAAFCTREKMSSNVSNFVHRLFIAWSDMDAVDADVMECLHKTDLACQRNSHGMNDDIFVSLAASALSSIEH
ncbi:hypothetical protein MPSEU_000530700 [Mayamaea pseudoterrestris]|nr:hypothetical protein MPSEU_000530700 [Mayamaea pseudoterrestris]